MARLIPLLLFLLVGLVLLLRGPGGPSRPRDPRSYRPRARPRPHRPAGTGGTTVLRASELAGLRDAYSGEPLDPARALVRCEACAAVYHADNAAVLARDNGGRCAACGSLDFAAARVIPD
jgi:hypothetical protein